MPQYKFLRIFSYNNSKGNNFCLITFFSTTGLSTLQPARNTSVAPIAPPAQARLACWLNPGKCTAPFDPPALDKAAGADGRDNSQKSQSADSKCNRDISKKSSGLLCQILH